MSATAATEKSKAQLPRVLVVDDEPNLVELIGDAFGRDLDCKVVVAKSVAEAKRVVQTQQVDLMVCDMHLPDGDGTNLLPILHKHQPLAGAIVMTGSPSMDGAITALRGGAIDFLPKPFTVPDLLDRVRKALYRQAQVAKSEARIDRLREAVRRLNEARKLVTKKVDLLCNDLVSAYGELSRQLDGVRTTESFRHALDNARDLEQMLCHAMDWMLRQLGYSNVAIWLAADGGFQLGAYMKYTIAGEQELVESMKHGLLPLVAREGFVHLENPEQVKRSLTREELKTLGTQAILGVHCTYLGESLATIALFRDATKPFTPDDVATLQAIAPVFAVTLASAVRGAEPDDGDADGGSGSGDADPHDAPPERENGPTGSYDDAPREPRDPRKKKKDDADWWKRGEPPPF